MNSLHRCKAKTRAADGLTLIEVVASIGLLATLLVLTLSIRASHVRQINRAFEIESAGAAIDQQMALWMEASDSVPVNESGRFPDSENFYWKTTLLDAAGTNSNWKPVKIRVEAVSVADEETVASLEILESPELIDTIGGQQ